METKHLLGYAFKLGYTSVGPSANEATTGTKIATSLMMEETGKPSEIEVTA